MRAPTPSEPKSTFPTYQVPQVSAMRGSAPPVQEVARAAWGGRADPPPCPPCGLAVTSPPPSCDQQRNTNDGRSNDGADSATSVINGSSCRRERQRHLSADGQPQMTVVPMEDVAPTSGDNSNFSRLQSVTENYCLLNNSVTVPKIQRKIDRRRRQQQMATLVTHNNNNSSVKLACKFGALPLGRDIPNQKSDDLEVLDLNDGDNDDALMNLIIHDTAINNTTTNDGDVETSTDFDIDNNRNYECYDNNDCFDDDSYGGCIDRRTFPKSAGPLRLRGGGESSLSTGTSGWGTPPSQQASNNNGKNAGFFLRQIR